MNFYSWHSLNIINIFSKKNEKKNEKMKKIETWNEIAIEAFAAIQWFVYVSTESHYCKRYTNMCYLRILTERLCMCALYLKIKSECTEIYSITSQPFEPYWRT